MDKKNAIVICLDSFCWKEFLRLKGSKFVPFISGLLENSIYSDDCYSQGPHTEVGVRGIIGECNTLDYGGSALFYENNESTIFDDFMKNNYSLFVINNPNEYFPERVLNYAKMKYYSTIPVNPRILFMHIIPYYQELYNRGELNKNDVIFLSGFLNRIYSLLQSFFRQVISNSETLELLDVKLASLDYEKCSREINEAKRQLKENENYIYWILEDEKRIPCFAMDFSGDPKDIVFRNEKYVKYTYGLVLEQLKKLHNLNAKKGLEFYSKYILNRILGWASQITTLGSIKYKPYRNFISNWETRMRNAKDYDLYIHDRQWIVPSLKKQMNKLMELINASDSPFMAYLQPVELHYQHNWFSFDIEDTVGTEKLFSDIDTGIQENLFLTGGYLSYRLALMYVDRCLADFWKKMEKSGKLNNTVIVITADHGSSYGSFPMRNALPYNNFYSENYSVPLIIYNNGESKKLDAFHLTREIPMVLKHLCNLDIDEAQKQYECFIEGNKIIHSEYLGPGVQDISRKSIWFTARNDKYTISYIVPINSKFYAGRIVSVFSRDDADEEHDIKNIIDKRQIQDLLRHLEARYNEIQSNFHCVYNA